MTFPIELFILFGVSVLCSSIGLYKFIYFISIGYGLSIAGCGSILLILHSGEMPWLIRCLCIILIVYGLRLAAYLAVREKGNGTYRRHMDDQVSDGSQDMGVKIMIWFCCAVLYAMMVSPICYRIMRGIAQMEEAAIAAGAAEAQATDASKISIVTGLDAWTLDASIWIGAGLMALGLILEWASDVSKNRQKKKYPGEVCRRGLYRIVRCPNYFGELVMWTGVLVSGVTSFETVGQWIIAGLGYLGIVFVMFSGTRRLEIRQNRTYGNDPAYRRYVKRVPIIIPFLPLYSVERWKWLVF